MLLMGVAVCKERSQATVTVEVNGLGKVADPFFSSIPLLYH